MENIHKVAILGGGESGVGAAILAQDKGMEVWLSDAKTIPDAYKNTLLAEKIPFEEGEHSLNKFFEADVIIKSPGIPEKAEVMKALRSRNKRIVSEIEFASWFTPATIIAITGSNGKTTTTSLIFHLLQKSGKAVGLGGNIGQSFAWQVARNPQPLYVLELSSFQLDDIESFRPHIAVLTNITPDHLDRYDYSLEKYAQSKFNITRNQTEADILIYNSDDTITLQEMPKYKIAAHTWAVGKNPTPHLKGKVDANGDISVMRERGSLELSGHVLANALPGIHNQYNALMAVLASVAVGVSPALTPEYLLSFAAIEHRMEKVGEKKGVCYINDSKATNVDSAWYALECMKHPVVWIAGGVDKGNDYSSLVGFAKEKVKALVILGPDTEKLSQVFSPIVPIVKETLSMKEAVEAAASLAIKGDYVLLSPCCASFDLFQNYEDRGRQFKANIAQLDDN